MDTKTMYMKVAIYTRVSKETSDHTNQLLILRDYCNKMNYEIQDEYVDVISGGTANRPEFVRMMNDASKRKFDVLLFYALDRFTREGTRTEAVQLIQEVSSAKFRCGWHHVDGCLFSFLCCFQNW